MPEIPQRRLRAGGRPGASEETMLPLTGYTDRFSTTPGGRVEFKVSSVFDQPYGVEIVRIRHGDPNPAGPGLKYVEVPGTLTGRYPSRLQETRLGSYARIADAKPLGGLRAFTVAATIWPTTPGKARQAVLANLDEKAGAGLLLEAGADGAALTIGLGDGEVLRVATGKAFRERAWYRIWGSYEAATKRLSVAQEPLRAAVMADDEGRTETATQAPRLDSEAVLLIAARPGRVARDHFNGKIERPLIADRPLADDQARAAAKGASVPGLVASWDFSRDISSLRVHDSGPNGLHGELVNLPTRAMMGSGWSGSEMCWRHAPGEYGAIHFHEDDLYDCGWETDFVFEAPADFPSGVYGARLRCGDAEDIIPFYVRPPTGAPAADSVFLASTFTYQVYGNFIRDRGGEAYRKRVGNWGARPWVPEDHPDYAHSTYNLHTDGSGICYSSRHRPLMTMRPAYVDRYDARGSGLRHFAADTHILDWLEAKGHDFDVVTDEDLDDEGVDLIAPYRVLVTTSHPEYHTPGTLDALEAYTEGGGRMIYLGGNGFYWRVARNPEIPGVLEIRRAEGGIRTWAAEPGEYYHALDGNYGGLWRRNGRPPQRLSGVGFTSQGDFEGSYYRRRPDADDARAAWIFEGVDDDVLGDFGLSGGGAAGFELDRADVTLGTPRHALVLATSEGHSETFHLVFEDRISHLVTWTGEPAQRLIRSDMVFFETPNGGAVFSVGSITFSGSLSHDGYDNNISRLANNVLTRFKDPAAFRAGA